MLKKIKKLITKMRSIERDLSKSIENLSKLEEEKSCIREELALDESNPSITFDRKFKGVKSRIEKEQERRIDYEETIQDLSKHINQAVEKYRLEVEEGINQESQKLVEESKIAYSEYLLKQTSLKEEGRQVDYKAIKSRKLIHLKTHFPKWDTKRIRNIIENSDFTDVDIELAKHLGVEDEFLKFKEKQSEGLKQEMKIEKTKQMKTHAEQKALRAIAKDWIKKSWCPYELSTSQDTLDANILFSYWIDRKLNPVSDYNLKVDSNFKRLRAVI